MTGRPCETTHGNILEARVGIELNGSRSREGPRYAHQFRHRFLQRHLASGMSMRQVAALIGDTERIAEMHYGKWNTREQDKLNAETDASNSQDLNTP